MIQQVNARILKEVEVGIEQICDSLRWSREYTWNDHTDQWNISSLEAYIQKERENTVYNSVPASHQSTRPGHASATQQKEQSGITIRLKSFALHNSHLKQAPRSVDVFEKHLEKTKKRVLSAYKTIENQRATSPKSN